METKATQRLESLDVLRGFDLFFIVALEAVMHALHGAVGTPWFDRLMWGFDHVEWQGFSPWDLIMPLFMFMSGITIPFALSKYIKDGNKVQVYKRIFKRVLLLWIFGMMCQGNLLGLDPHRIFFFSNTLQAIAVGYLFSALLFLNTGIRAQLAVAVSLLLLYWGAMEFISIKDFGGGDYSPDGNLAEGIDRLVLGRFRDASDVVDGKVVFADWYRYTWLLSSLNFIVTVMSGMFAGYILKSSRSQQKKTLFLLGIGAALVALGWLWNLELPIVKKIWTSSMVLVSSGYCFLLMGLFYWWIDVKGHRKGLSWLKIYGMNSILAYLLASLISFHVVAGSVFHGLEQYIGPYYHVLINAANAAIIFFILWMFYRKKIFLRV